MNKDNNPKSTDIIFYSSPNGDVRVEVFFKEETFWLNQKKMAELFGCGVDNISLHLKNIFKEKELDQNSVSEEIQTTASDGKNYKTKYYNLDAIIAVGYRVNSIQATQFRIWATKTLKEYIIKGFILDDKRLKQGETLFGKDYFRELLERIRSIRASERRIYISKSQIFLQNVVLTTILTLRLQRIFMPWYKTNFILQYLGIQLPKLFIKVRTQKRKTWDLTHGKLLQKEGYYNLIPPSPKIFLKKNK